MQVRELVDLARFLKTFLRENRLAAKYQELIVAVKQMAQNQNPEVVQNLVDEILQIHRDAERQLLSPAQLQMLSQFGGDGLVGRAARQRLEELLNLHRFSPPALATALQEVLSHTNDLESRSGQFIESLEKMLSAEPEKPEIKGGEGTLWLKFDQATDVQTVADLEKAAEMWKEVLHHFSRLPNATAEGGRILYVSKYSPLEIQVAAQLVVLLPMAYGIRFVLSRVEQVISILQQAELLKQMKVKTQIIKELRKDAREKRKAIVAEAADSVQAEFNASPEARNAVQLGLGAVLKFIEKGGVLDIDVKEPEADEPDQQSTEAAPTKIRDLISSVRAEMKKLGPVTRGTKWLLADPPEDDPTDAADGEDET